MANVRPYETYMFVRMLYDYNGEDENTLTLRAGDMIQVITQLESGWWDGVIDGVRGWFPSNYCVVLSGPGEDRDDRQTSRETSNGNFNNAAVNRFPSGTTNGIVNGNINRLRNRTRIETLNGVRNGISRL